MLRQMQTAASLLLSESASPSIGHGGRVGSWLRSSAHASEHDSPDFLGLDLASIEYDVPNNIFTVGQQSLLPLERGRAHRASRNMQLTLTRRASDLTTNFNSHQYVVSINSTAF